MPFIFLLGLGLLVPRVTVVVLWFLTSWFSGIFSTWVWPLVGVIFAPYTLLWYSVVVNVFAGVWGPWQLIGVIVALALDLSSSGSGYRRYYVVGDEVV